MSEGKKINLRSLIKSIAIPVGAIILVLILNPVSCIGPTQRGIHIVGGKPGEEILQPGINFHVPLIGSIKKWDIKPRTYDLTIDIASRGAISSDNQIIGAEGKIVWNFDPEKIAEVARRYPSLDDLENIIKNTSYAALKTEIGKRTIFDLAREQAAISTAALANLKLMLAQYPIEVTQFNVTNFDWSSDFDAQINATMAMKQQVEKAKAEADRTEQEQRKLAIEAEAGAKALVAKAQGELDAAKLRAEAARVEAEGIAAANKLKMEGTSFIFQQAQWKHEEQMAYYEAWNGVDVSTYLPLTAAGGVVTLPGRE
jgi:regulator of protease activity HflC (stomatin/prohibitin superfamily)